MQSKRINNVVAAGLIALMSTGTGLALAQNPNSNDNNSNSSPTGPGMKPAPVVPNQTGSAPQPDHIPGEATTVPPDKYDCRSASGSTGQSKEKTTTGNPARGDRTVGSNRQPTQQNRPPGAPNSGGPGC
jgi:hypothetical protein